MNVGILAYYFVFRECFDNVNIFVNVMYTSILLMIYNIHSIIKVLT